MSGSKTQTQTTTSAPQIPAYLEPFLSASAGAGTQGIQGLQNYLGNATGSSLVAGFSPAQAQSQNFIIDAMQPGGAFRGGLEHLQGLGRDAGNNVRTLSPEVLAQFRSAMTGGGGSGISGDVSGYFQNFVQNPQRLDPSVLNNGQTALNSAAMNGFQLDPNTQKILSGFSQNPFQSGAQSTLSGFSQNPFQSGAQATLANLQNAQLDPTAQNTLTTLAGNRFQLDPTAQNALTQATQRGFQLDPAAQQALSQTASGGHLFGTPAFDEAVQASIRSARPHILSAFGQGGSGAIKGGLAQAAIQQAASDSFAKLYGSERANQLGAAGQLGNFGLGGLQQQLSAAGQLGNFGLAGRGQQIDAAGQLGNLGLAAGDQRLRAADSMGRLDLAGRDQQLRAADSLGNMELAGRGQQLDASGQLGNFGLAGLREQLNAAGQIGNLALQGRGQELNAATNFGNLGLQDRGLQNQSAGLQNQAASTLLQQINNERNREFQIAQTIPGMGLVGAEALSQVGGQQQALEQQRLNAELERYMMLINAGQGIPFGSLLGQTQTQSTPLTRNRGAGLLGGAATGAQIGSLVPGIGTMFGAIGGGLLGAFG